MPKKPTYEELEKRVQILDQINFEREQSEITLNETKQKWRNNLVNSPQIVVSLDSQARITFSTNKFLELTGWEEQEIIGQNWFDMFIPDHIREEIKKRFYFIINQTNPMEYSNFENEVLTKTGEIRNVAWFNIVNKDVHQDFVDVTCLGIDLTERYQAEEALRLSHENFLTVLNSIDATVYVADMETYEILFANKNMIESFGRDATGELCYQVFRGETKQCGNCTNDKLIDTQGIPTGLNVWDGRNPITQKCYMNYDRAIKWNDGRIVKLQIATDITDLKNAYGTIKKMSVTDELTQLFNRRHFHTQIDVEIQRALRYNRPLSLILLDIDYFKKVNDEHGHQVGDAVLVDIASILRSNVRKEDVVARYGGEEFVVILPEIDVKGAYIVGEKLRRLIENHIFEVTDRKKFKTTASFGVSSMSQLPAESPDKAQQIIKQADIALYEAKKGGRNLVALFSANNPES